MKQTELDEPPPDGVALQTRTAVAGQGNKWSQRETPVKIEGNLTNEGMSITISSILISKKLNINYPKNIWGNFPKANKQKLLDNIIYIFTAHLPLIFSRTLSLEYNIGYPQVYSWVHQCFMRHLPAYWHLHNKKRGTKILPLLKNILNSHSNFELKKESFTDFAQTKTENVIIPFTFGKDSLLSYNIAKEIGLKPTLVYFNDPIEDYEGKHKKQLIEKFTADTGEQIHYLENHLGKLRSPGEGWFGWELALTSWGILSLPFAYTEQAKYIIFSNEISCNDFFYDDEGFKIFVDYEQSGQATKEISLVTGAISHGQVLTTTFLQGIYEMAILAVLKDRYPYSFNYLMSCWAENEFAANKRWCANCSKCARIYVFLTAIGIDPKSAGFEDNLLLEECERFFNIFGAKASGNCYDSFGTNRDEQLTAFYLTALRGNRDPLIKKFINSPEYIEAANRHDELINKYFGVHTENVTPLHWKKQIDTIFESSLKRFREELKTI